MSSQQGNATTRHDAYRPLHSFRYRLPMICMAGAKLLEKMTFRFSAQLKVEYLAAILRNYRVEAKVNGVVVAQSPLGVLPGALLSATSGADLLFEINRPVKRGDRVTADLVTAGFEDFADEQLLAAASDGITISASVSVLCELQPA